MCMKVMYIPVDILVFLKLTGGQRANIDYIILFREYSSMGKQMCTVPPSK